MKLIYVPRHQDIIVPDFKVRVAGRFSLKAHKLDSAGNIVSTRHLASWAEETPNWFNNLVLDAGLNRMGTGSWMDWCQVGTGSTAPANSDTALVTRVAGSSTIQASSVGNAGSAPNYYGFQSKTYRFVAGTATGILAEVGVGWASTGSLFSRALIKDGGGSPTTVTVLSDEVLDVTYEFRAYTPTADSASFPVTFNSVTYNMVVRTAFATDARWQPQVGNAVANYTPSNSYQALYSGAIGSVTTGPSGTAGSPTSITPAAYSNNSLQRDFDTFWDLNDGNAVGVGGANSFLFCTSIGAFQVSVDTPILKTASKKLHLNSRVSWARHP